VSPWPALAVAAFLPLAAWLAPALAEPAPKQHVAALTVETLGADKFDLSTMRGKVVLVNFWATWCAPCLAEMPAIAGFYKKHREEGFEVIALSLDKPAARAKMARVAAALPFPAAVLSEAVQNGFGTPKTLPLSFIVDADGMVKYMFIAVDEPLLNEKVLPLLKEAQAASKVQ